MSSEEREGNETFELLIARYLEAENSGQNLDRDGLIEEHPDLADSLRKFFANHDRMKAAASLEEPTLPPNKSGLEDPTIPPSQGSQEDATIPPQLAGDDPILPATEGSSSPDEPSVGDQVRYFGDYELLEEIARGGMGVVFKARQINLNRIVALKMILSGEFAGEEDVERFHTEAEAAAQLDHPGIVPIFEIGEHAGQHYFSMGYIEGESLAQKVADGPLPPREAAELVKKICDAMAYAHDRGVIHRDLKPANILIDQNGQPKITDFGLAKKTQTDSDLTGTGQILGTPAYMPPEQAAGRADVGPLADVYSLGAILYCLLTGRPPFQAANPMDTLLQVLERDPIPPHKLVPGIPKDIETVASKAMEKEVSRRYHSAVELHDDVGRFLDDEPIHARPVGQVERCAKWAMRNPVIAALLITLPGWLFLRPSQVIGLLAFVIGFHLLPIVHVRRLLFVFVASSLIATYAYSKMPVSRSPDEPFLNILNGIALRVTLLTPFVVTCVWFLIDSLSQARSPRWRNLRVGTFALVFLSAICLTLFACFALFSNGGMSLVFVRLMAETSGDEMMSYLYSDSISRILLRVPLLTIHALFSGGLGVISGSLVNCVLKQGRFCGNGSNVNRVLQPVPRESDSRVWISIAAAIAAAMLPLAVSSLLLTVDIALSNEFQRTNPFVGWFFYPLVTTAAVVAAYGSTSARRCVLAISGTALFTLGATVYSVYQMRDVGQVLRQSASARIAPQKGEIHSVHGKSEILTKLPDGTIERGREKGMFDNVPYQNSHFRAPRGKTSVIPMRLNGDEVTYQVSWPDGSKKELVVVLGESSESWDDLQENGIRITLKQIDQKKATIMRVLADAKRDGNTAVDALVNALLQDNETARDAAYELFKTGQGDVAVPVLLEALKDNRQENRRIALQQMKTLRTQAKAAVPVLIDMLHEASGIERGNLMATLAFIGSSSPETVPAIVPFLKDESWQFRRGACSALRQIGPAARAAVPELIEALRDEREKVRIEAIKALGAIGPEAKSATSALKAMQDGSRSSLDFQATSALEQINGS